MCGFVGAFGGHTSADDVAQALNVISYRGPHGTEQIENGCFQLSACRLAIVPPLDDPPLVKGQNYLLALNGEVYDLSCCPESARSTDSERLAAMLLRLGRETLPKLDGLFAFCFYHDNQLLLARDRFGIKPLYYARHRGGIVFSSEIKALLSLPGFVRDVDLDVMVSFDAIGYNVTPGRTPFSAVHALLPGTCLVCQETGQVSEVSFASLPSVPLRDEGEKPDALANAQRIESLLGNSISKAVLHDPQPKAVFFSGGLDSTLLLDLVQERTKSTAFVLTDRADNDDLIEAQRLAHILGVPLCVETINEYTLAQEIVHYAWHFEHPIASSSFDLFGGVAFHALARAIARDFRVAFCGEGADELFMGYHRYHMDSAVLLESIRQYSKSCSELREWAQASGLFGSECDTSRALRNLALHQGLSEYHLPSVDRSGMAFGLEIRPLYLSTDLVEYVAALDETVLVDRQNYWTKLPLRNIVRRRLGEQRAGRVVTRRKRAMAFAVDLAGSRLHAMLGEILGLSDYEAKVKALFRSLFIYLHVDPGFTCCPDFSLLDFAEEWSSIAHPWAYRLR